MEIFKENKVILIIVALIVALLGWYMLSGGAGTSGGALLTVSAPSSQNSVDDRELLQLLTDMRNIRLEGHIFESTSYLSLQDFGRSIIPEPVGRRDPFATLEQSEIVVTGGGDLSDEVLLR